MTEKRYSKKQHEELQNIDRDITRLQNKLTKDVATRQEEMERRCKNMTRGCTDKIKELNTRKKLEQEKLKSLQTNEEQAMRRKFVQQQDDLNKEFIEPFIQVEKDLTTVTNNILQELNKNLETLQDAHDAELKPLQARREEILAKPINVVPEKSESQVQVPVVAPVTPAVNP
jgi:hypothetical protein